MTTETTRQFDVRQAIEEKTMSETSTDKSSSIPHGQLSKSHADEAQAIGDAANPQEIALEITETDENVIILGKSENTCLTPEAAMATADRLLAKAREVGRRKTATRLSLRSFRCDD